MKTIKVFLIALVFTVPLSTWAQAQSGSGSPTSVAIQGQGQYQDQTQGNVNYNVAPVTITKETVIDRNNAIPYQLYPPNLAPDFGNGNTYGNFVKVPAAFIIRKRFSRCELQTMCPTHGLFGDNYGVSMKFRTWGGPRVQSKSPGDYVDFVWELPSKPALGADGRPKFDEKGHPVMAGYVPDTWCELGTGTASVTNGDADTYSLIGRYGLFCLDTGACNKVFLVGEGVKTFIQAWGWNLSAGWTQAYVSASGEHSGVGGIGAGFAYAKTGRLADPWLQGHFIYDSESEPPMAAAEPPQTEPAPSQ